MRKHETELAKIALMYECSYSYRTKLVVECRECRTQISPNTAKIVSIIITCIVQYWYLVSF